MAAAIDHLNIRPYHPLDEAALIQAVTDARDIPRFVRKIAPSRSADHTVSGTDGEQQLRRSGNQGDDALSGMIERDGPTAIVDNRVGRVPTASITSPPRNHQCAE